MNKFKVGDKCRESSSKFGAVFEVERIVSDDWFTVKGQKDVAYKCSNFELVDFTIDRIPLDWKAEPGAELPELRAVHFGNAHLGWELFKWGERIRELNFYEKNFVNSAILETTKVLESKTKFLEEENKRLQEGINVLISELENMIQYIHGEPKPAFCRVSANSQILQSLCMYLKKLYKLSNRSK